MQVSVTMVHPRAIFEFMFAMARNRKSNKTICLMIIIRIIGITTTTIYNHRRRHYHRYYRYLRHHNRQNLVKIYSLQNQTHTFLEKLKHESAKIYKQEPISLLGLQHRNNPMEATKTSNYNYKTHEHT